MLIKFKGRKYSNELTEKNALQEEIFRMGLGAYLSKVSAANLFGKDTHFQSIIKSGCEATNRDIINETVTKV